MAKTDPELVRAVVKYREQKAKIKARQRAELEVELLPWAGDVGVEITRVRNTTGASIQDIADIIGIQNRTFIYKMINAKPGVPPLDPKQVVEYEVVDDDHGFDILAYTIEWYDNVATVIFPEDERYDVVVVDGTPDLPDEWAEHSKERRAMYKDIVKAIREHYKG